MAVQVMGAENSKWSESFSLDTVGSEGVFSCEINDGQMLQVTVDVDHVMSNSLPQMGTKVHLSSFNLTKVITITPFYMIHNKTRVRFTHST